MAKISRVTASIFGSAAGSIQLGVFGSLAAGSPQFSNSPATIQSLSNWTQGWFSGVIGGNSPAIEDFNAVDFVASYQIAYMLQQGIPEYDAGTTYYKNAAVTGSSGVVYQSQTDSNSGNTPAPGSNWVILASPKVPSVQVFTSTGSATYTPAANTRYIVATIIGGGGGGAGGGSTQTVGTSGQLTSFGSIVIAGGGIRGGTPTDGSGGAGGSVSTLGSGYSVIFAIPGSYGGGAAILAGSVTSISGGDGGVSVLGGAGGGASETDGTPAVNGSGSGGGGGGAGTGAYASVAAGPGGGAGGAVKIIIPAPLATTYALVVGNGGSGGYDGVHTHGGNGGIGTVIIEEY